MAAPIPTHPEAAALYRAILASPDEDTPRLVYADWLQENGEPDRAEFIRAQCRLARANEWDDGYTEDRLRVDRLLREHQSEWLTRPDGAKPEEYGSEPFRRGFMSQAVVKTHLTAEDARLRYAHYPIGEAKFPFLERFDLKLALARLTFDAYPHLRTIHLDLDHGDADTGELKFAACTTLANAECRSGLTRLEIGGNPTLPGLSTIVTSPHLRQLKTLSVVGEGVGDDHARLLAERMKLPALRELVLGHRALTPAGGEALGKAKWFNQIETIRLYGHDQLGDDSIEKLLDSQPLPNLRTVQLHYCGQVGGEIPILGGPGLPGLVEVIATGNYTWGNILPSLTAGPQHFLSLDLSSCGMNAAETAAFCNGSAIRELRQLNFRGSAPDTAGVVALVTSPLAGTLRSLHLRCHSNTDPGPTLLAGRVWSHLARLSIPGGLAGESLLALIESPKFPKLVSLATWCLDSVPAFLKKLAKCPAVARLRELDLNAHLTPAIARELADSPYLDGIDRLAIHKGRANSASCERLVQRFGKRIEIKG
jgi:uncharacterized protein (TIGR02996 family)